MAERIMVVEDEPRIALDIECALEAEGLGSVGCVPNLCKAKQHLTEHPIEFALIDSELAAESAALVADHLRSVGTPFIVITAASEAADWTKDVPVVEQPFDPENLARTIRRLCKVRWLVDCMRSA